jgi:translation initiation factor 3 subunit B
VRSGRSKGKKRMSVAVDPYPSELYKAIGEEPIKLNDDFSHVVVLDGLPVVTKEKFDKLIQALKKKFFSKLPKLADDASLFMPMGDDDQTLGCMFLEFESKLDAKTAVREGDKFPFDKKHTFRMTLWEDFESIQEMDEKYEEPKVSDYETKGNIKSWMLDDLGRDMYVIRHGKETEIYWNDPIRGGAVLAYGGDQHKEQGKNWTELYVTWSTNGLYLATYHRQGIVLWAGEKFDRVGRFPHDGVRIVDFSPCEKYIVTFNANESDPECFIFWDIRSGKVLRHFAGDDLVPGKWPVFKWSFDGKYVARKYTDQISVYESSTMNLIKNIKVPQLADFEWSPSDDIISYWVPEFENNPATVSVVEFPSLRPIREKHYYQVHDIRMYWQNEGTYLCVRIARVKNKAKPKITSTNFEVFMLKEKNTPVEVLELSEQVHAFAWEPKGKRFAMIHGEAPKIEVSLFKVTKGGIKLEHNMKEKQCNSLFWSPAGDYLVMAGLGSTYNGLFEFYSANEKMVLASREHLSCNEVTWDSSGRYLCTAVTQPLSHAEAWKFAMNNGYKVWSVCGTLCHDISMDRLYMFRWRPRPPTVLSEEELKQVKKSLRDKHWRQFDLEDEKARESQLVGEEKKRADLKAAWKKFRSEKDAELKKIALRRKELGFADRSVEEDDYEVMEVIVEEELSNQEEVIEG